MRNRTERQVFICLVVVRCCTLKIADQQAHNASHFQSTTKCTVKHCDTIKARGGTVQLAHGSVRTSVFGSRFRFVFGIVKKKKRAKSPVYFSY